MGEHAAPNPLAVTHPTRGADRSQSSTDSVTEMLLPSLDDGITLLDGGRSVPIVQSLVLDHLLLQDGPCVWVDTNGHATTTTLARIAPSRRLLDRIHVARGFTAYQHYSAVCDLPSAVDRSIQGSTDDISAERSDHGSAPHAPTLIVVPALDARYRADDSLAEADARTLQARTLARLRAYADRYESPVLVTRSERDAFTTPIRTATDHHLEYEQTRMGLRIVGDEFETAVYPVDCGAYYQTTFAYWQQLLAARATQVGMEPAAPPAPAGVGTGVTADGETGSVTTDPLLDAWTTAEGR